MASRRKFSDEYKREAVRLATDPRVTPARVLAGHLQDQFFDLDWGPRTTELAALAAVVLPRDQPPVPSKQSVRRHEGADLEEPFSTDCLCLGSESTALRIGESQSLSAQLLVQRSILLLEIFDHILLVQVHPAGEDQYQKLNLQRVHRPDLRPAMLGRYRSRRRVLSISNCTRFSSADFGHTTRSHSYVYTSIPVAPCQNLLKRLSD